MGRERNRGSVQLLDEGLELGRGDGTDRKIQSWMELSQPSAEMEGRAAALEQEVTLFCRFDPHNREQRVLRHGLEVWWPPTSSTALGSLYQAAFGGGLVAEGRVVEAGRIHQTPAGEFIDDLVDELELTLSSRKLRKAWCSAGSGSWPRATRR